MQNLRFEKLRLLMSEINGTSNIPNQGFFVSLNPNITSNHALNSFIRYHLSVTGAPLLANLIPEECVLQPPTER